MQLNRAFSTFFFAPRPGVSCTSTVGRSWKLSTQVHQPLGGERRGRAAGRRPHWRLPQRALRRRCQGQHDLVTNAAFKVIESVLRAGVVICDEVGLAPLDDTGAQLLFRFVAAAYERRSLVIASHWLSEQWGHFMPDETTAVSLLDHLIHHCIVVVTDGESFRMKEGSSERRPTPAKDRLSNPRGAF